DEERVVGLARRFRDGMRGGRRQLVRLADDEGLERVTLVERRRGDAGLVERDRLAWRHEKIHLGALLAILLHAEHHGRRTTEPALRAARQHAGVLRLVPLHRELIGGPDDQPTVVQRDRLCRLEPRSHGGVREFPPCFVEEAFPGFFSRLLHPRLTKGGTSCKGGPKVRVVCGKVNLDRRARDSVPSPPLERNVWVRRIARAIGGASTSMDSARG